MHRKTSYLLFVLLVPLANFSHCEMSQENVKYDTAKHYYNVGNLSSLWPSSSDRHNSDALIRQGFDPLRQPQTNEMHVYIEDLVIGALVQTFSLNELRALMDNTQSEDSFQATAKLPMFMDYVSALLSSELNRYSIRSGYVPVLQLAPASTVRTKTAFERSKSRDGDQKY